jgi:hypothetical protein
MRERGEHGFSPRGRMVLTLLLALCVLNEDNVEAHGRLAAADASASECVR